MNEVLRAWTAAHSPDEAFTSIGSMPLHDVPVPTVVIDWDNTLHPYMLAAMLHPECPQVDLAVLEHYYHFHELVGGKEKFLEFQNPAHAAERMLQAGLYEGAQEAIAMLVQHVNVVIMTHRRLHHGPNILRALRTLNVPFMFLITGAVDKIAFYKSHAVDLLIDDKPTTLESAHAAGLSTASLIHAYNQQTLQQLDVPSAHDWLNLLPLVFEQLGLVSDT